MLPDYIELLVLARDTNKNLKNALKVKITTNKFNPGQSTEFKLGWGCDVGKSNDNFDTKKI